MIRQKSFREPKLTDLINFVNGKPYWSRMLCFPDILLINLQRVNINKREIKKEAKAKIS